MPATEEALQPRGDQAPTTKMPRRKPRLKKPVNELLVKAALPDVIVTARGNPRMTDFLKTPRFRNAVVNGTGTPENHFDWVSVELDPAIQSAETRLNDWKQVASAEDVKPHARVPLKASPVAPPATVSAPASAQAPALQTRQPAASVTMEDVLDRFDKVQNEIGTLKRQVGALEQKNRTLEQKNRTLEVETRALKGESIILHRNNSKLEGKIGALERKNKTLVRKVGSLKADNSRLTREVGMLKRDSNAQQRSIDTLMSELNLVSKKIESQGKFIDTLMAP